MLSSTSITARRADLTTLAVDAIVNAANSALAPGGGVCGAIHRAAGPALAEECATLSGCPTGDARITRGYRLPARHVIHAVGPRWQGGHRGEAEQIASAYRRSLEIAEQHALHHVAFPAISTGIYGYPLDEATVVAVSSVRAFFAEAPRGIEQVIFTCIDDRTLEAYCAAGVSVD